MVSAVTPAFAVSPVQFGQNSAFEALSNVALSNNVALTNVGNAEFTSPFNAYYTSAVERNLGLPAANAQTPSDAALNGGTSLVNLNAQALNLLNGVNNGSGVASNFSNDNVPVSGTLTAAQLQDIANIISPFSSQPLTQETFNQMQAALVSAGYNPVQISLQNIFIAMEYDGVPPVTVYDAEAYSDMGEDLLDA